ncbi:hypothetical protein E3N88_27517 [Mikania micrantha]|uniref:Transmembrane protein n=1 Tax=Mikania micrantha TaxID=192012 RepID=A0A5N6MXX3_9ASTR|nr:hypothetical protein E3N88_27517 [Mikania micrantha]
MMDEGSNKRKKKRGKSLIFSKWFWLFWNSDDNKILASDDNLVYRDDTGNAVNGDAITKTKSSSSYGGRMSSIFKAVLFDTDDDQNLVTTLKIDNNCINDTSSVASSSPKTKTPMVVSSGVDTRSQLSNERKVMSRVNSTKKKPPLPSGPKSSVKTIPKRNNKPTTLNNSTFHLCLLVIVVAFVSVVLWMSFTSNVTESLDLDSDLKIVDVGNEL